VTVLGMLCIGYSAIIWMAAAAFAIGLLINVFGHFSSEILLLLSQPRLVCEADLWAYDRFLHESWPYLTCAMTDKKVIGQYRCCYLCVICIIIYR
jgi:hypothetical protein